MPDTDVNKPGQKPSSNSGTSDAAPSDPLTLEEELDRLLAEIEVAVDDLDPLGELEQAAEQARAEAKASDPEYDETEDLFDVVTVGSESEEAEDAAEAPSQVVDEAASALDNKLDGLIEEVAPAKASQIPVSDAGSARPEEKQKAQMSAEQSQIDHELDALLAEANAVLGDDQDADAQDADAQAEAVVEPIEEAVVEVDPIDAATEAPADADTEAIPEAQAPGESTPATPPRAESAAPEAVEAAVEEAELPEAEAPVEAVPEQGEPTSEEPQADAPVESADNDVDVAVETIADVATDAAPEDSRSIEDLDADLAARAEEVAADESESESPDAGSDETENDAFRSSEDVVEEVIDEHASAVQETESAAGDSTDDLAQLMAESPASAQLGVAEGSTTPPAPTTPSPAQSAAAAQPETAVTASAEASPDATAQPAGGGFVTTMIARVGGVFEGLTKHVRPLAMRVARVLSKPLELMPPKLRDDIGWLATVTLFLAIAVMVAYFLFR